MRKRGAGHLQRTVAPHPIAQRQWLIFQLPVRRRMHEPWIHAGLRSRAAQGIRADSKARPTLTRARTVRPLNQKGRYGRMLRIFLLRPGFALHLVCPRGAVPRLPDSLALGSVCQITTSAQALRLCGHLGQPDSDRARHMARVRDLPRSRTASA